MSSPGGPGAEPWPLSQIPFEKMVVTVTISFKSGGDKSPSSHTKLRLCVTDHLLVLSLRLHTVGNRAFTVAIPKVWNSLPDDVVSSASLSTFCRLLVTFLFSVSFSYSIL